MNNQPPKIPNSLITVIIRLKRAGHSEDGFIIFITVALILLLGFLWTASALMNKLDNANANATESANTGFYGAEFGLNRRASEVRQLFEASGLPSGSAPIRWEDCIDGLTSNDGTQDMRCQTYTLTAARNSNGAQQVTTFMQPIGTNPSQTIIPPGQPFSGLQALEYSYRVSSVARNSNRLNQPSAILGMEFRNRLIPLFQFAVFYNDDGDFTIPPNMNINGRVHSNGNLYLNAANNATLSINGQITVAGVDLNGTPKTNPLQPLIRGEKSNEASQCSGTVRIMRDRGNGWQNLNCNGANRTRYGRNSTSPSNIPDWESNLQLGVPLLTVPPPGDFGASPGSLYWDNADLRVVLNVVNDSTAPSGTRVTGIEVQNVAGTQDVNATTALHSCAGYDPTGTTIVQSNSTVNLTAQTQGAGSTPTDWIGVTDNTANRFRVGDLVTIGDGANRDWDSNALVGPVANNTDTALTAANSANPVNSWGGSGNRLRLRRQVGFGSQGGTVAVTNGATIRKAVVSSSDTFFNYREKYSTSGAVVTGGQRGQYIRMLNVDIRELMNCAFNQPNLMGGKALNETSGGGLVWYFTVRDNTGNTNNFRKYGIRLYNGRYLAPSIAAAPEIEGLAVVSNQAVYIQGDYNLKDDNTSTPVSVSNDPNTTRTERWRPAAILADTINILSNRWQLDDFNGTVYTNNLPENQDTTNGKLLCRRGTYDINFCDEQYTVGGTPVVNPVTQTDVDNQTHRPPAWQTWVNAAFLAGTVSPANEGDAGTGGVNNYPRFHELWRSSATLGQAPFNTDGSTLPFNYRGSFVSLRQPVYTTAPFCGSWQPNSCNIYSPPVRNWDYDSTSGKNAPSGTIPGGIGFNDAANLPPMTPRAVYLRQELFTRSYDRTSINVFNPLAFLPKSFINLGWVPSQLK